MDIFCITVTMHPESVSFLARILTTLCARYITTVGSARKLRTHPNNPERRRLASRSPKLPLRIIRAGGKLATDETEKRQKFSNTRFLPYKKTIFRGRLISLVDQYPNR